MFNIFSPRQTETENSPKLYLCPKKRHFGMIPKHQEFASALQGLNQETVNSSNPVAMAS